MRIAVLGVGRSGTTVLYHLLQEILADALPGQVEYVFEPFLWDRDALNRKLGRIVEPFQYMRSLSMEGLYQHHVLPLFIPQPAAFVNNAYLRSLFTSRQPDATILLKFIRANGRYPLLKAICPDCKFVFMLRNPVDVINSALTMFSLLGEDFHASDFPRLVNEVNALYPANLDPDAFTDRAEREVLYWYYMNRFALERFEEEQNKPLIICYERLFADAANAIHQICAYLGVAYKPHYPAILNQKVNLSFGKINLTHHEYRRLLPYLTKYTELLATFRIADDFNPDTIRAKYAHHTLQFRLPDECYGKTPIAIRQLYQEQSRQMSKGRSTIWLLYRLLLNVLQKIRASWR